MKKKKVNKLIVALVVMAVICLVGIIYFVSAEKAGNFDRITNLEVVQKGSDILIDWDDMDCECYDVHVSYGEDNSYMITTDKNHIKISDVPPETEYTIGVAAQIKYDKYTDKEELTIKTK